MPLTIHVWDIMDRAFKTIGPEATLGEAMELMSEAAQVCAHSRSLIVVNKHDHPLGVISMRNILDAFKPEFSRWAALLGDESWEDALHKGLEQCNYRLVEDYMVTVPSLKMSDTILTVFKLLTDKKLPVRALPVVEAEKVEGVVRIPDLFEAFVEAYRKQQ